MINYRQFADLIYVAEYKRRLLERLVTPGPLKDYLAVPFPKPSQALDSVPILALDFETTGLNARKDKILSAGYVSLQKQKIKLGQSQHHLVQCNEKLKAENVVIHQITDESTQTGEPIESMLQQLLQAMAGKVVLAHFARIEKQFLKQACLNVYGYPIVFPVIDTLIVEKRKRERQHQAFAPSDLRLPTLREHYGLPGHYAHNALNDALATAELFLVQLSGQGQQSPQPEQSEKEVSYLGDWLL